MAKTNISKKISVLAGVIVAAIVAVFVAPVFHSGVFAAEHSDYYNANKELVELIDSDAKYFSQLDIAGDEEGMAAIVSVAQAVRDFEKAYEENDYVAADWADVQKAFRRCRNNCKVSGEDTDLYNYYLSYDAARNISEIARFKAVADAVPSKQDKFDDLVEKDKAYIDNKVEIFLKDTHDNPDIPINQLFNLYDAEAQAKLYKIAGDAKLALDAMALDKNAFEESLTLVDEKKEEYSELLNAVERNDLERACSAIKDYYAAEFDGAGEEELAAKKVAADALVEKGYTFLHVADPLVVKKYVNERAMLDRYSAVPKEHDFSDLDNKSSITSEDGVVTVTAYAGGEEVAVIPYNVTVKISDNSGSIYKLNAENAIVKKDRKISVAYCFDVTLYKGTGKWECVKEVGGKEVTYKVAVDLEKFYSVCVDGNDTWLSEKLAALGIGKEKRENYTQGVKECAEYLSVNDTDASLCYHYLGRGEVEGLVASVENDTIIFETKSFSNFAVAKAGGRSVLTSPVFWLIFILAVVLAFVAFVVIMACVKYTIRFCTDGGTEVAPVKARKDEYFVMPQAPAKRGYVFGGWFEDPEFNVRFVDTFMVKRRSFKVYAKWNVALSAEQAENYYLRLRELLAAHAAIGDGFEIRKGEKILLAELVNEGMSDKLYLALDPDKVMGSRSFAIKAADGDRSETPLLKVIESPDDYLEALDLIDILIAQYALKDTAIVIKNGAAKTYALEVYGEEFAPAEPVEPAEEPTEQFVEDTAPTATKEQLLDYFKEIRKFAKGFALAEDNPEIDKEATVLRVYLKDDCVEVYLNGDPDALGVEKTDGVLAEDTPAFTTVCCDKCLESAKAAIRTVLEGLGLEETGLKVDLGDSDAKSFGYKLKYAE